MLEKIKEREKKVFREYYRISSEKIRKDTGRIRIHVISDFHANMGKKEIQKLMVSIKRRNPDLILVPGDCIFRKKEDSVEMALYFMEQLSRFQNVFFSPGNHETFFMRFKKEEAMVFYQKIRDLGIRILDNKMESVVIRGSRITIYGLELPAAYYKRFKSREYSADQLACIFPERNEEDYEILMAHNPQYGDAYFDWGADLTVSGHFHGGFVRLGRHTGVLSPAVKLFPKYCCGDFYKGKSTMIVSGGIGEHVVPVCLFSPRVLVEIDVFSIEK